MDIKEFKECNSVYAEDQDEYENLPVHLSNDNYAVATSCWKFTWLELLKVIFTRRIYAKMMTFGKPLQPIKITVDKEIEE